jgi:signal transduction histidine kinase
MEELPRLNIREFDPGFLDADNDQARRQLKVGQLVSIQSRYRRKDGTTVPVEIRIGLLSDAGPRQILAVVRDLSEREQAQESELRARKAESLVLMAGGIAHDFNNLFQAIQGNLEVAGMRAKGDPLLAQPLSQALGVLKRAVSLSWKMLDFSGHGLVRQEPLHLEDWLPAYLANLRLEFPPAFKLDLTCEPVPLIQADRLKLEQVVKAVLDNALEAAPAQAGRAHLRLFVDFGDGLARAEAPGVWPLKRPEGPATVCLEIADEGPGVPPGKLDLVCDPFYTTKAPGRGLGLPAGVGILNAHRAGLHLFNGEAGGLVVRMHFPPGGV